MSLRHAGLRTASWSLAAAFVAGCAHHSIPPEQLPLQQRHISDFAPTMKGSSLDYRCEECSYTAGIDDCRMLGSAPLIATVERPVELNTERRCDDSGYHDFSTRCRAKSRLRFERAQDMRAGPLAPDTEFLMEFEYPFVGGDTPPAPPFGAAPRVVFAFPLDRQSAPGTDWNIAAICPLTSSR